MKKINTIQAQDIIGGIVGYPDSCVDFPRPYDIPDDLVPGYPTEN